MRYFTQSVIFLSTILITSYSTIVQALPGQTVREVSAWIASHPTLAPASRANNLLVRKNNTAAQRFTFQAFPQSSLPNTLNRHQGNIIASERFEFFDMVNGVTVERLEETLRTIYGINIHQDFQNAQIVYNYPSAATLERARRQNLPLLAAQRGQLRLGENFAYWLEVTNTDTGIAYNGHLEILFKEDLPSLQARLQQ